MLTGFNRGFGKLLDNNGQKRRFLQYGLMMMEFNRSFERLVMIMDKMKKVKSRHNKN